MMVPPSLSSITHRLSRAAATGVRPQAVIFAPRRAVNFAWTSFIFSCAVLRLEWSIIAANVIRWCVAVSGSYVSPRTPSRYPDASSASRIMPPSRLADGRPRRHTATSLSRPTSSVLLGKALAIGATSCQMARLSLSCCFSLGAHDRRRAF